MNDKTKAPATGTNAAQGQQEAKGPVQAGQETAGNGKPAKRKVGDPVIIALSVCNDAIAELTPEQRRRVLDFLNASFPPATAEKIVDLRNS